MTTNSDFALLTYYARQSCEVGFWNSDGTNNVQEAEAISWAYYLPLDAFPYEFFIDYNDELVEFAEKFNANSQYIEVYLFTSSGIDKDVNESFENDLQLILLGIILISLYTFFVVGKFNFNEDGSVKDSFSIVLMRDYFAKYLLKTPVRITILCIFTILVFLNIGEQPQ